MTTRRNFLRTSTLLPLAIESRGFSQVQPSQKQNKIEIIKIAFQENSLEAVYLKDGQRICQVIAQPHECLTSRFTFTGEQIPFLIEGEENIICFLGMSGDHICYDFLTFSLEQGHPIFNDLDCLDMHTRDEFGRDVFQYDDKIHSFLYPTVGRHSEDFLWVLIENDENSHLKICQLHRDFTWSQFSVQCADDISGLLMPFPHQFFDAGQHIFSNLHYGDGVHFFALKFDEFEHSFCLRKIHSLNHNQSLGTAGNFQFPNPNTVNYFGNDIDSIYTPFQYSFGQKNPSFLIRKTDFRYACVEFYKNDQGAYETEIVAVSKIMDPRRKQFVTQFVTQDSSKNQYKEVQLWKEKSGSYFLLSIFRNENGHSSFLETPLPLSSLIKQKISLEKDTTEPWHILNEFFLEPHDENELFSIALEIPNDINIDSPKKSYPFRIVRRNLETGEEQVYGFSFVEDEYSKINDILHHNSCPTVNKKKNHFVPTLLGTGGVTAESQQKWKSICRAAWALNMSIKGVWFMGYDAEGRVILPENPTGNFTFMWDDSANIKGTQQCVLSQGRALFQKKLRKFDKEENCSRGSDHSLASHALEEIAGNHQHRLLDFTNVFEVSLPNLQTTGKVIIVTEELNVIRMNSLTPDISQLKVWKVTQLLSYHFVKKCLNFKNYKKNEGWSSKNIEKMKGEVTNNILSFLSGGHSPAVRVEVLPAHIFLGETETVSCLVDNAKKFSLLFLHSLPALLKEIGQERAFQWSPDLTTVEALLARAEFQHIATGIRAFLNVMPDEFKDSHCRVLSDLKKYSEGKVRSQYSEGERQRLALERLAEKYCCLENFSNGFFDNLKHCKF